MTATALAIPIRVDGAEGLFAPYAATVDTGFSGGLLLPKKEAKKLGIVCSTPSSLILLDGQEIQARRGIASVTLPGEASVSTWVDVPVKDTDEVLIGFYLLCQMRAVLTIGAFDFAFPRVNVGTGRKPNPSHEGPPAIFQYRPSGYQLFGKKDPSLHSVLVKGQRKR